MLRKNILANYLGAAAVGISNFLALAFFTSTFGLENWGYVATYLAIVNTMLVADLGISQIYVAEFGKSPDKGRLFIQYRTTIAALAFSFSVITTLTLVILNATGVLNEPVYGRWDMAAAAGLLLLLSLINNFYYTHLSACEAQVQQNLRWVGFTLLRNTLAIVVIKIWGTDPIGYFMAFCAMAFVELGFNQITIREKLQNPAPAMAALREIPKVLRNCGLLSIAIVVGVLVFNLDRLVLPGLIDTNTFGAYAVVATVGLSLLQLQYPIMKAFFPRVARQSSMKSADAQRMMMIQLLVVAALLIPLLGVIAWFAEAILRLFSVPQEMLEAGSLLLCRAIILAVLINAFYHVLYQRLIAQGLSRDVLIINLVCLVAGGLIITLLGAENPFVAGAIFWVTSAVFQLLGGCYFFVVRMKNYGR